MKNAKLTVKQEKFCMAVVALGCQSEAYRSVYNCANSNNYTVNREASRLKNNPKITTRISDIQQVIESEVVHKKIWVLEQLDQMIEDCLATHKTSAAIKAIDLMCKMQGWYKSAEKKPEPQIRSAVIIYDPDNNNEITRMEG